MAEKDPNEFAIKFVRAGLREKEQIGRAYESWNFIPVEFSVSRGEQSFNVKVFVDSAVVAPVDYVKIACHQLAVDFAQLAEQAAEMRLPEEQVPQRKPETPFPGRRSVAPEVPADD